MTTLLPSKANDRTTLILSKAYLPFGFLTARATIKHLMTGRVKGMDCDGNLHDFSSLMKLDSGRLYENTPHLQTVNREFPIPTIVVSTRTFGFKRKQVDRHLSTKNLYRLYRGICQYCLEKIPISEATKDHYIPKSVGGTNHDFNLVLACRKCNHLKDSQFPYYNVNGEVVKPKNFMNFHSHLDYDFIQRKEWESFLCIS